MAFLKIPFNIKFFYCPKLKRTKRATLIFSPNKLIFCFKYPSTVVLESRIYSCSNKTLVFNNNGSSTGTFGFASAIWTRTSDTVVTITTGGDGRITNGSFEIRIYV